MNASTRKRFTLSIDNDDFKASLIVGKVYRILPDAKGALDQLIRIVDESGEDYLYPESLFLSVASLDLLRESCFRCKLLRETLCLLRALINPGPD
jgi:hypothetical protein